MTQLVAYFAMLKNYQNTQIRIRTRMISFLQFIHFFSDQSNGGNKFMNILS